MERSAAIVSLLGMCLLGAADPAPILVEPGSDLYPSGTELLQGDVPVSVRIDERGGFACSAQGGTELGPLRRASCELLLQRNAFHVRIVNSKAVPSSYSLLVRWNKSASNRQFDGAVPLGRSGWVTYADYPAIARHEMQTGKVVALFEISEQGAVQNCKVAKGIATNSLAGPLCPLLESRAGFLPALDKEGHPRRASGSFTADWRYCDTSDWRDCPPPDRRK